MNDFFNQYSIPLFSITGLCGLYLCIEKTYFCCKRRRRTTMQHQNSAPVHAMQRDTQINPLRNVYVESDTPHSKHNMNSDNVKQAVKVLTSNKNRLSKNNNSIKNNLYKVYFPPTSVRKLNKL